jgi:hypothetical protein
MDGMGITMVDKLMNKDLLKKYNNILEKIRELSNVFIESQIETDKENRWFILDRWKDLQNIKDKLENKEWMIVKDMGKKK